MKSKEEMIGFELPSFEEFCGDYDFDTSSESAREQYEEHLQDCMRDIEINEKLKDEV